MRRNRWVRWVVLGMLVVAPAAGGVEIDSTLTVQVTSIEAGITDVAVGDVFVLEFTVDDVALDVNPSIGGGQFPGLVTSFSMTGAAGNVGSWTPAGVFDIAGVNSVTNAFGDGITLQPDGAGFPDGGPGFAFHGLDLSFDWPHDLTDSGTGDSFAQQLAPTTFGLPPAALSASSGIQFTDGLDFPVAHFEEVALAEPIVFFGEIDSVPDPLGLLPASIQSGSTFVVEYRLDASSAGTPLEAGIGLLYPMPMQTSDLVVRVEGETFLSPIASLLVANDRDWSPVGPYTTGDGWVTFPRLTTGIAVGVIFHDSTGTQFADEAAFVNDTLAGWDQAQLSIVDSSGEVVLATGVLLGAPSVPVFPSFLVHVLLGLCLLTVAGRTVARRS